MPQNSYMFQGSQKNISNFCEKSLVLSSLYTWMVGKDPTVLHGLHGLSWSIRIRASQVGTIQGQH